MTGALSRDNRDVVISLSLSTLLPFSLSLPIKDFPWSSESMNCPFLSEYIPDVKNMLITLRDSAFVSSRLPDALPQFIIDMGLA